MRENMGDKERENDYEKGKKSTVRDINKINLEKNVK